MSIYSWLFGKGIAKAISLDLLEKYFEIKSQFPHEGDEQILERVWNLWLEMNNEPIKAEDDEHKIVRLSIIKEKYEKKTEVDSLLSPKSLFDLYRDILYIETEILMEDGKIWRGAIQVFLRKSKERGLDFTKEYESYRRIMGKIY